MTIRPIQTCRHLVPAVQALGDANRKTLGFLPAQAFADYVRRDWVLVATNERDECVGYLLYRISQNRASLAHLCVASSVRGEGVGQALVSRLIDLTSDLDGIRVHCRQDFEVNALWPRLGFRKAGTKPGRNAEGKLLDVWVYHHGRPDLFSILEEDRLPVLIDANVFFDLVSEKGRENSEEALGLLSDHIFPNIALFVAPELEQEILRNPNEAEKQYSLKRLREWAHVCAARTSYPVSLDRVKPLLPVTSKSRYRDESDRSHVAWAVASQISYFLTRDERILGYAETIEEAFGVKVLRPVEFICHLDELWNTPPVLPGRLMGTTYRAGRIQKYDQKTLTDAFFSLGSSERKTSFERSLRSFRSHSQQYETICVTSTDGENVGLIVLDRSEDGVMGIPLLRGRSQMDGIGVAHSLLLSATQKAAEEGRTRVKITDAYLTKGVATWLEPWGFFESQGIWTKVTLSVVGSRGEMLATLEAIKGGGFEVDNLIHALRAVHPVEVDQIAFIERALWPAKITDGNIPTYIVPIRPAWAHDLFDTNLSEATLFGAPDHLGLSRQNVYYRAGHPLSAIKAPGRILWYVSADRNTAGSKSIRACSVLEAVDIARPLTLHQRYQAYGVYKISHLRQLKSSKRGEIMALRFCDTELFTTPVPFSTAQGILEEHGVASNNFVSPQLVTDAVFEAIYRLGQTSSPSYGSPSRTNALPLHPAKARAVDSAGNQDG